MDDLSNLTTSPSLLEKLRDRGDKEAWTRFFLKYWRFLHGICKRHLSDEHDADDALQIIFQSFLQRDRFRTFKYLPPARFQNWLRRSSPRCALPRNDARRWLKIA